MLQGLVSYQETDRAKIWNQVRLQLVETMKSSSWLLDFCCCCCCCWHAWHTMIYWCGQNMCWKWQLLAASVTPPPQKTDAPATTSGTLSSVRVRVKTPRVVAAAALNSVAVFPENVSLRLRPTCLPLTILAAAISLTQIPEGLRRSFRSALVFPPSCENFRAVIGAGLSNDLAPPSQNYRYYICFYNYQFCTNN